MIPNFKKSGLLPAGVHYASWNEFTEKFDFNKHRHVLAKSLLQGLKLLFKNGCEQVYIGGSFVTDKPEPGDVDVCFDNSLMKWAQFQQRYPAFLLNENGFYDLYEKYKANFYPYNSYDDYFLHFFQYSRTGEPKGLVKLNLKEIFAHDKK